MYYIQHTACCMRCQGTFALSLLHWNWKDDFCSPWRFWGKKSLSSIFQNFGNWNLRHVKFQVPQLNISRTYWRLLWRRATYQMWPPVEKTRRGCLSCGCCIWDGENYFHSWDMYWNAKSQQVTVESEAYVVRSFYSTWNTPIGDRYSGEVFFPRICTYTTSWAPKYLWHLTGFFWLEPVSKKKCLDLFWWSFYGKLPTTVYHKLLPPWNLIVFFFFSGYCNVFWCTFPTIQRPFAST